MNVLIAQFAHISPSSKVFDKYLNNAFKKHKDKKIDLIVLGDFVANKFFKEYRSKASLKREFASQEKYFSTLAQKYNTTIIAPLIECKQNKYYKSILIVDSTQSRFYRSSCLMDFIHWNEREFFDNDLKVKEPLVFKIANFNVSVIFGWEAHFDETFIALRKKGVDVLIIPTANTFSSNSRWIKLLSVRSFLNNCFIVRVNRVGNYMDNNIEWKFYGESFIALPDGNLGDMLGDKEGILVSEISESMLNDIKNTWKFR